MLRVEQSNETAHLGTLYPKGLGLAGPTASKAEALTPETHMISPGRELRVILIGGSSHVGKSTLAQSLASKLGWRYISTDSLARHPGQVETFPVA